ncbi:hypothetical protein AK812_SmicGene24708 [Symbiodinium microadriaticum]|uniref:Uncharacterized protein n=1 Tax=Symbiodinium microadriaticum TaxID=2951 RepID=A0A1Q9DE18_SYMMI|nr:hypothetical protein AK812_SmicGene24708 [Symbiodinium microadriaticum]
MHKAASKDLATGLIGGTLSWVPPASISEVISYTIYLADSANTPSSRTTLGSVAVGTNSLAVSSGTASSSSASHFFVHSESALGLNPNGAGLEICDVSASDSLFLQNAVATSDPWGVADLSFHRRWVSSGTASSSSASHFFVHSESALGLNPNGAGLEICDVSASDSLFLQNAVATSDPWGVADLSFHRAQAGYEESKAVDGDPNTPWVSSCSACSVGQALIGVIGVCKPEEVRCVQLRQCTLNRGDYGCPLTASRAPQISLLVQGQHTFTWRVMQGQTDAVTPAVEVELLSVPSRRRRATLSAFVDVSYQVEPNATVNPGFTSKLDELKKLGDPVVFRFKEYEYHRDPDIKVGARLESDGLVGAVWFIQRYVKRPLSKTDIVYAVSKFGAQCQAVVKLNALDGQEYAGELCRDTKSAERSAAEQAVTANMTLVEATKQGQAGSKRPAVTAPSPVQVPPKKMRLDVPEENPALTPKAQLNSLIGKIAKRAMQKGETIYNAHLIGNQYQATVQITLLPGEWANRAWAGHLCGTKLLLAQAFC